MYFIEIQKYKNVAYLHELNSNVTQNLRWCHTKFCVDITHIVGISHNKSGELCGKMITQNFV